ncbi:MAG: metallophosphoesterase [Thermoplasmata archaeon]
MTGIAGRKTWAVVAAAACAVVVLAGLGITMLGESAEAQGGDILAWTTDGITVRCLGPEVTLSLHNFEGLVTFTNCFPNSTLTGHDGPAITTGSNVSCQVDGSKTELRLSAEAKTSFRFAVMGDSQGYNDILAEALEHAEGCEFVVHCGDMTASGQPSEYDSFEATLRTVDIPVMTTPGNHDVKLGGSDEYDSRFGATAYAFEYSGIRFAFVDSSDQIISEEELDWLKDVFEGAERKVLVTHMPSYDPFGNNHTLDAASCDRVQDFILEEGVDAVFTGHIHAYHFMQVEDTDFLITGGAGAALVDGVHHVVIVTVNEDGFSYEKVDLGYVPPPSPSIQVVGKGGECLNLTYDEMMSMSLLEADSSYENLYGNIAGQGHYKGVLVRDLLELVGGMAEGDLLRIAAVDGYSQEFGFLNAYPNSTWLDLQGEMIVALELDGVLAGGWSEGPRTVTLPEDGLYSNSDCALTSYEGQGYWVYESAGARWVRNTLVITVVAAA